MATWTKAFGRYVNLIVTATESEINVANNTSKVTVNAKLHYHTGQTTTSNWNNISYYLKIDGTSYVSKPKTTSNGYTLSASSRYKDLGTYSKTITHGSDGSKSINIYVDFDDHDGWRALANETMKLATIARASIPTVSATSVAIGSAITIYTNRKSSSFRHELTFKFASRAVDTLMSTASTADRVTWTLPNDMANAIPNSTSNGGTFTLKTYNGSTLVGTNTVSITVTVPSNSTFNPTMGTPSYTDVGASSVTGVIDGKSKLKLTGTASPKMGATVKSIKLNFSRPGYSTSYDIERSGNTGTYTWGANTVATWSMSMTVTDSRGRSATSGSISIPVVAYSTPKLSVKASRSGTSIVLSGNATGASLSSSNTLTLETYIRTRGATSWGTVVNTATSTTGTVAPTVTTYSGYATTTSYEVRVRVKDELSGWTETILPIATKKALLDMYKDVGVGIGKYYETAIGGALQVGGLTTISGDLQLNNNSANITIRPPSGHASIEMGSTSTTSTPYIDFHSSGTTNDFDVRLIASGGQGGSHASGKLDIYASVINMTGRLNTNNGFPTIGQGIVHSGSNSNGFYAKFDDGTMICWKNGFVFEGKAVAAKNAEGNLYRSGHITWSFPATFVAWPLAFGTSNGNWKLWVTTDNLVTGACSFLVWASTQNQQTNSLNVMAIGRWK